MTQNEWQTKQTWLHFPESSWAWKKHVSLCRQGANSGHKSGLLIKAFSLVRARRKSGEGPKQGEGEWRPPSSFTSGCYLMLWSFIVPLFIYFSTSWSDRKWILPRWIAAVTARSIVSCKRSVQFPPAFLSWRNIYIYIYILQSSEVDTHSRCFPFYFFQETRECFQKGPHV